MGWWPFNKAQDAVDSSQVIQEVDVNLKKYSDDLIKQVNEAEKAPTDVLDFPRSRALQHAARNNCAEFTNAYSKCISYGSFMNRSSGCNTQLAMFEKCQEMQMFALYTLGFDNSKTEVERTNLKAKADDLMIEAAPSLIITPEQEQHFEKLVSTCK